MKSRLRSKQHPFMGAAPKEPPTRKATRKDGLFYDRLFRG
jgi:hypothetical protein